jgi:serine/threonine-protein kinase
LAGRYVIERELGAGGMATVYLARDLKHDRGVALKVLRSELAAIIGVDRFLAEIKTTAGLQHPHILPLHDSGEAGGSVFYVMPYVEGESLRDRLNRETQLPVADALRLASEVASALDYAHRRGVIHRDIKPENILLHDGRALVADFGIALAVSTAGGARMTETGMSLGTPHYMSPEQAMGEREITARSDVYALGCVLYEMLAGEPPFTGPTAQAVVAKVMTAAPAALSEQRHTIPAHVESAVMTALEKLPADRFGTAAEFALALATPTLSTAATARRVPAPSPGSRDWRRRVAVPALAVAGLMAAAFGWMIWRAGHGPPPAVVRMAIALPNVQLMQASRPDVEISPLGTHIVYPGLADGRPVLLVRALDRLDADPVPGSEGGIAPFFSPDGRWIGFVANGKLKRAAIAGGPPITIADAPTPRGATWTDDGYIVFAPLTTGGLVRVPADGGPVEPLTTLDSSTDAISHRWPAALPGGRAVLFQTYNASFAQSTIAVLDLSSGRVTRLAEGATRPLYAASGHLLYVNADGALVGRRYDPDHPETAGAAVTLLEGVSADPATAGAGYAVSRTGSLVYLSGSLVGAVVRVDRAGARAVLLDSLVAPAALRFSSDGRRLAMELQAGGVSSIWVYDLARRTGTRLTFDGTARYPSWHPTRDEIVFAWNTPTSASFDLFQVAADGSGPPRPVYSAPYDQFEGNWTPDGRRLAVRQSVPESGRDLWIVDPDSASTPREFLRTRFNERAIALSPDGHWLAYASDESGIDEVYVRAWPGPGGKWQISNGGGTEPAWSWSGRELFYRDGRKLVAVSVQTGAAFNVGTRTELFTDAYGNNPDHTDYAVHPSGTWFAMRQANASGRDLVLVLNWFEELRAKVPR